MSETAPIRETVDCDSPTCPCVVCREKRGDPTHETEYECIAAGDHFKRICTDGYCTMCGRPYDGDETSDEDEEEEEEPVDNTFKECNCVSCRRDRGEKVYDSLSECTDSGEHGDEVDSNGDCVLCGYLPEAGVEDDEEEEEEEEEEEGLITTTFRTAASVLISRDVNRRRNVYVNTELLEDVEKEFRRIRSKLSDAQARLLAELISCDMPTFIQTQATMGAKEKEVARSVAAEEHETTVSVIRSLCRLLERRRRGVLPTDQNELELPRSFQIFSLEDLSSRLTYCCFQLSTFVNTQVKLALDTVPASPSDRSYRFAWVNVTGL